MKGEVRVIYGIMDQNPLTADQHNPMFNFTHAEMIPHKHSYNWWGAWMRTHL